MKIKINKLKTEIAYDKKFNTFAQGDHVFNNLFDFIDYHYENKKYLKIEDLIEELNKYSNEYWSEYLIIKYKLTGVIQRYSEGALWSGIKNNNTINYLCEYRNGKKHGMCKIVKESDVVFEELYENNKLIKRKIYNNNKLKYINHYKNKKLHGVIEAYYTNGQKRYEYTYSCGKPCGKFILYNEDGCIKMNGIKK